MSHTFAILSDMKSGNKVVIDINEVPIVFDCWMKEHFYLTPLYPNGAGYWRARLSLGDIEDSTEPTDDILSELVAKEMKECDERTTRPIFELADHYRSFPGYYVKDLEMICVDDYVLIIDENFQRLMKVVKTTKTQIHVVRDSDGKIIRFSKRTKLQVGAESWQNDRIYPLSGQYGIFVDRPGVPNRAIEYFVKKRNEKKDRESRNNLISFIREKTNYDVSTMKELSFHKLVEIHNILAIPSDHEIPF